jgi:hypothetical protein
MKQPIALADIVEAYIKENNLPFYLEPNVMGKDLMSIRQLPKKLANSIGFVSGQRAMVCIYNLSNRPSDNEWISPFSNTFFEELNARLHLYL